jgi:hypothetical protein
MATKRQRIRYDIINTIWVNNVGSTGSRDTDWDDYAKKYNLPDYFGASLWRKARADIVK